MTRAAPNYLLRSAAIVLYKEVADYVPSAKKEYTIRKKAKMIMHNAVIAKGLCSLSGSVSLFQISMAPNENASIIKIRFVDEKFICILPLHLLESEHQFIPFLFPACELLFREALFRPVHQGRTA